MEPTYRIDLEHDPADRTLPWTARIVRLSDDTHVKSEWGTTRTEAFDNAQSWVRAKAATPERPSSVHVTEDGEIHTATPVEVAAKIVNDANRATLREVRGDE
jgi:hypothetical protein